MAVHEATDKAPRVVVMDRVMSVYVHDDAAMTVPRADWMWQLNWCDEPYRPESVCSDRQIAMSVCESYRYLVMECTKEEAWQRIQQLRRAIRAYDKSEG